ncbi:MAG: ABC transporter permease [Candidatus Latescibacterota bacterium]|jgi:putative ABC transport system permease protein
MLRSYLLVGWRNLWRNRLYSAINVVGLAAGIAFALLALLYVRHEWSYDSFHEKADQVYRVVQRANDWSTGRASMPEGLAPTLAAAGFPEILQAVTIERSLRCRLGRGNTSTPEVLRFVSPGFLQVFTFPLLAGDAARALHEPGSIVITEATARRHFGDTPALGQVLSVRSDRWEGDARDFTVAGVLADVPSNSSLQFTCLMPLQEEEKAFLEFWVGEGPVYLRVAEGTDAVDLGRKLTALAQARTDPRYRRKVTLGLQPLTAVHLDRSVDGILEATSDPVYSYVLAALALAVLLVACVNFITLAIGRSASRAREVGVRKVVGGTRQQLMVQFWSESVLLALLATVLGGALTELMLPTFCNLTGQVLSMGPALSTGPWALGFLVFTFTAVAAGAYPAARLSALPPARVLAARLRIGGDTGFTRLLISGQFAVSLCLVVCALVIGRQLEYLKARNLGFHGEQVVTLSPENPFLSMAVGEEKNRALGVFRERVRQHPHVLGVTRSSGFPMHTNVAPLLLPSAPKATTDYLEIDDEFISTLGIDLIAGTGFAPEGQAGQTASVVVNEALVRRLGLPEPIGARLPMRYYAQDDRWVENPIIIGVVRDFHYQSLHAPIKPLALFPSEYQGGSLCVRISPEDVPGTLSYLRQTWSVLAPSIPLSYSFLDDEMDALYRSEERWGKVVGYASLFAVLIACLGAFGLTAQAVARRTREIGIRKVLGASVGQVTGLLCRQLLLLIGLASAIGGPLAYHAMHRWLGGFAYRVELGPDVFLVAAGALLVTAMAAVGPLAFRAALANPVDALRQD